VPETKDILIEEQNHVTGDIIAVENDLKEVGLMKDEGVIVMKQHSMGVTERKFGKVQEARKNSKNVISKYQGRSLENTRSPQSQKNYSSARAKPFYSFKGERPIHQSI